MGFSTKVKEDAMVASGRHCCLCHKFCGLKIEIHHIKPRAEGGADSFENAIPLCFDCHGDMRTYDVKHPKGTKYTEAELIRRRNDWYQKVRNSGGVPSGNSVSETDKVIYSNLLSILPWEGSLQFISSNNFAGFSFQTDKLKDLYSFLYACENPAFEFIDSDLESAKSNLMAEINNFTNLIGQNTFPTNSMGFNHVPPEWEMQNHEYFHSVVNQIHDSARNVCKLYQELTRMAAQKLSIVPRFS
ncbi:HNH endonuclease [Vibrio parahaemolyticus]|uniref:HNH endonuclease n=1 Tax=Vibrio parahaemolyticus TaxID=670 RepID=UPI0012FA9843|nr:HNH endonuclease [Vibrio parahaemolyticus]EKQ5902629.1 HNH endonuclease [Vibrio parahaemolyticus]ELA8137776.1 HNH endonuclease [Vibrio parahaemolyticus]MDF4476251.1 HNH endonuclease [Vibrio parahaemolyticus]MDF4480766.1 HNH endonuclease [Vibrio parahaemolyticus]MDG3409160.1 HNH endonuclease [Vibrio parahaemolyticus]